MVTLLAHVLPAKNKMSIVERQSREPSGQMCLLFFVFRLFFCSFVCVFDLQTSCELSRVNEVQLCVTELIQSWGPFYSPAGPSASASSLLPSRRCSLTGKLNKSSCCRGTMRLLLRWYNSGYGQICVHFSVVIVY